MLRADFITGFKFKDNFIIYGDVGKIFSNFLSFEINLYLLLNFTMETTTFQLLIECILIYSLQKSVAQIIIHFIKSGKNDFRLFFE